MILKSAFVFRSWNLSLIRASPNSYFSTSENQKDTYLHDRAFLASSIIKRIWAENKIDHLSHLPLHKSITTYLKQVQKINENARLELLEYFQGGIILDHEVWTQVRFKDANLKGTKEVVFYPTKSVTSQIFKRFLYEASHYYCNKKIITGNFGISKSFSVALLTHLCNMVSEYHFKKRTLTDDDQYDLKKKKFVLEPGLINAPKIIYLNYTYNTIKTYGKVRDIILKQFNSEIPKQDQSLYLNNTDFLQKPIEEFRIHKSLFPQYAKRKMSIVLIVDQISEYFSLLRKKSNQKTEDLHEAQKNIHRFKGMLEQLRDQFEHQVVYLSSMDIEMNQLNDSGLKGKQTQLWVDTIEYSKHLWKQQNIKEIIEIYLHLYQQKFENVHLNDEQFLAIVKSELFNYLFQRRNEYFTSILFIRQMIQKTSQLQKLTQDKDKLKKFIFQLFKNILSKSEDILKERFQHFFTKRYNDLAPIHREIMQTMIFELYLLAKVALKNNQKLMEQQIPIDGYKIHFLESLNEIQKKDPPSSQIQSGQLKFVNIIYKQFFEINQERNVLRCTIPATIIEKSLKQLFPQTWPLLAKKLTQTVTKYVKQSGKGEFIQVLMTQMFPFCKQVRFRNHQSNQIVLKEVQNFTYGFEQIKRDEFDQKTKKIKPKNWNFLQSFEPTLTKLIQQTITRENVSQQSFFFTPKIFREITTQQYLEMLQIVVNNYKRNTKNKKKLQQYLQFCKDSGISHLKISSLYSKAIDFVFVQIDPETKTVKFQVFDVTISKGKTAQKIIKFIDEFLRFSDKENQTLKVGPDELEVKIQLGYYVVCPLTKSSDVEKQLSNAFGNILKFNPTFMKEQSEKTQQNNYCWYVQTVDKSKPIYLRQVGSFDFVQGIDIEPNVKAMTQNYQKNQFKGFKQPQTEETDNLQSILKYQFYEMWNALKQSSKKNFQLQQKQRQLLQSHQIFEQEWDKILRGNQQSINNDDPMALPGDVSVPQEDSSISNPESFKSKDDPSKE